MTQGNRPNAQDLSRQQAEARLCAEVLADAQRDADELLSRARAQAAEIVAAAEQQVLEIHKEAMDAARAEALLRSGFILAAVPLERARMRAARIESVLDELRAGARCRLDSGQGFDCGETLILLASEALAHMAGDEFVLGLCARDHGSIGPRIAGEVRRRLGRTDLRLETEADPSWSECGVIVRDRLGQRVWDNRLSARLERMWPAMRREIARRTRLADLGEDTGAPP